MADRLRIGDQFYFLEPGQDIAAIKSRIVAAAYDKTDFVEFETVGYGHVAVLITGNDLVRFETRDPGSQLTGGSLAGAGLAGASEDEQAHRDIDLFLDGHH
jgi:hypothetical protein